MRLITETFFTEIDELDREGVRVVPVGDRSSLSIDSSAWDRAETKTAGNTALVLNVAFN